MKFFIFTLSFTFSFSAFAAEKTNLSLVDYLEQVRTSHLGFVASEMRAKAAFQESKLGRFMLSPQLLAKSQWYNDGRPTLNPASMGSKTKVFANTLGLSKLFSTGTQAKVTYELNHTTIEGTSPSLISQPKYYDASPTIEVSQSLWKNFFGSETRAMVRAAEAQFLELSFMEQFKLKQILAAAEATYWKYFISNRLLAIREQTLERAKKIRTWSKNRMDNHLADRSDFLQGDAAYRTRQFETQQAQDEQRAAALSFNTFRGVESSEVKEKLSGLNGEAISSLQIPVRASRREDLLAAEQRKRSQTAQADQTLNKSRPSLDATGSIGLHSRNSEMDEAFSQSFKTNHNTYAVGVNLVLPLDFWAQKDIRAGAHKERKAAELDYQRKFFEQEQEWRDLSEKFVELKKQLTIARELESAQREKSVYEQERLHRGRSTTYQVLVFEQDYEFASLNLAKTEFDLLTTYAQLKTFSNFSSASTQGEVNP